MSKAAKVVLYALGSLIVLVVLVVIAVFSIGPSRKRHQVDDAFKQINLPTYFKFENKIQNGDLIDSPSEIGWVYDYSTKNRQTPAMDNLKTSLQSQGFQVSGGTGTSQPGTLYARSNTLNLYLFISYSSGQLSIQAEQNK